MSSIRTLVVFILGTVRNRTELAAEHLALRQRLVVMTEQKRRPRLRKRDHICWARLSRLWADGLSISDIVQTRHRGGRASAGLQALLALEVKRES